MFRLSCTPNLRPPGFRNPPKFDGRVRLGLFYRAWFLKQRAAPFPTRSYGFLGCSRSSDATQRVFPAITDRACHQSRADGSSYSVLEAVRLGLHERRGREYQACLPDASRTRLTLPSFTFFGWKPGGTLYPASLTSKVFIHLASLPTEHVVKR